MARVSPATLLAALFLAFVLVALVLGVQGAKAYTTAPTTTPIEPNPGLETNVTEATHFSTWNLLTYQNSSNVNQTFNASLDPRVVNPIQITPSSVLAPGVLQAEKITGIQTGGYWNSTNAIAKSGATPGGGGVLSNTAVTTVNGQPGVTCALNTTKSVTNTMVVCSGGVPAANFPSQNVNFDYLTTAITFSGAACANCFAYIELSASSTSDVFDRYASNGSLKVVAATSVGTGQQGDAIVGGQTWASIPLASLGAPFVPSTGNQLNIQYGMSLPSTGGATSTYTLTIVALAFTTTPLTFGTTTWGKAATATTLQIAQAVNLSAFSPTFTYTQIAAAGWTLAMLQQASNLPDPSSITITYSALAPSSNYTEQVTYGFRFAYPVAAGLTYGTTKLIDRTNIWGGQYVSVAFGGTSYSATYSTLTKNWTTIVASTSATTGTVWLGVIDFTGAQWDSISTPPGFFSAGGFQYYWFVFLGLIGTAIGIPSAWVVRQQRALKVRHGFPELSLSALRARFRGRLRLNERGIAGRHGAVISISLILLGSGLISLWAFLSGSDTNGVTAAFIGGLLLLFLVAVIAYGSYEIAHWVRHRRHA
ncbi:MAG TPA: hypothetical protein VFF67_10300 [Thermoplasmata archaeon]|nr:hypothetical protein [Thermoplasmata archaeon]